VTAEAVTISVVIPVRDGASTLGAQLQSLVAARSPRASVEVIVADNGSIDATVQVAQSYSAQLTLHVVDAREAAGANAARNAGVRVAAGDRILVCDADDEVDADWLVAMERAFDAGHELLAGYIDYRKLNPAVVAAWRGADRATVMTVMGFLPAGHGANMGFTRRTFDRVRGFDEGLCRGGDDVDFCWRAQLAGVQLVEVPDAVVHYRLRSSMRAMARQAANYGAGEPALYRRFAGAGLRRRPPSVVAREVWWLVTRAPFVWSRARRGAWVRRASTQWGRLEGMAHERVWWW
jgi:glycosyltransferase involved in cell wall biosynthesis